MKIAFGNDHTALALKQALVEHVQKKGHEVLDVGACANGEEADDYPVYGEKVGVEVAAGRADCGIVICGTGIGISLAANKVPGIRAAVCSEPYSARLTKQHNNANVLALGARVVAPEYAKMIVDEWLDATFEGGRHQRRIDMISDIERRHYGKE